MSPELESESAFVTLFKQFTYSNSFSKPKNANINASLNSIRFLSGKIISQIY